MSKIDDGGPAFPVGDQSLHPLLLGMTLRDYFATHAPHPTDQDIAMEMNYDRVRNPHNDSYKPNIRDKLEIIAALRYRYADAMLKQRGRP